MSFLNNLAKGFVRSAVNQVGRDGGKVISNKIYGDRHSTPIRVVGATPIQVEAGERPRGEINSRIDLKKAGYKPDLLKQNPVLYFFELIGGLILPIVGPLYWVYLSLRNLFKRYTQFFFYEDAPVYVRDRRYKSGARVDSYRKVKSFSDAVAKPTGGERVLYVFKSVLALAFAVGLVYCQYSFYKAVTAPEPPAKIEKGVVINGQGANLRIEPNVNATVLALVPINDSVQIVSKEGPTDLINNIAGKWYKVKYKTSEGWVWSELIKTE